MHLAQRWPSEATGSLRRRPRARVHLPLCLLAELPIVSWAAGPLSTTGRLPFRKELDPFPADPRGPSHRELRRNQMLPFANVICFPAALPGRTQPALGAAELRAQPQPRHNRGTGGRSLAHTAKFHLMKNPPRIARSPHNSPAGCSSSFTGVETEAEQRRVTGTMALCKAAAEPRVCLAQGCVLTMTRFSDL